MGRNMDMDVHSTKFLGSGSLLLQYDTVPVLCRLNQLSLIIN